MFICTAGDIHGVIDRPYDDVISFEESLGMHFDYVLHVGAIGVRSGPDRLDNAARKHDGARGLQVNYGLPPANHRASADRSGNTLDTPEADWFERRAAGGLAKHGCRESA